MKLGRSALLGSLFSALLPAVSSGAGQSVFDSCVACHGAIALPKLSQPVKDYAQDIHAAKGFGCVACHGGDARDPGMGAMAPAKGFIGTPPRTEIPRLCGRCHSDARFMRQYNPSLRVDQVTEYYTSVHGQLLARKADPRVAVCSNCHPAHGIRPASDPRSTVHPLKVAETCGRCHADAKYMEPYKIPTDQLDRYKKSAHWRLLYVKGDLSAPTCNDCHGNHGAAPPGVSWVGNVCGQCHALNFELFNKSVHAEVFVRMGIPGCAACHGNHDVMETSDAMLGVEPGAVCAGCHSTSDKGGQTAAAMRKLIDSLAAEYREAAALLARAERAGMPTGQAQFELNESRTALVKARASIHAFDVGAVSREVEPGVVVARKARARAVRLLEELQFRRRGLAVSVLIILAVVIGLVLKIRQIERGQQKEGGGA